MASKRFRDAVGIDPDRIVAAAVEAALGETPSRKKNKHHPGRVLAAGAAVAAAAAVGQRRMPKLAKVPLRMGLHKLGDMAHVDDLADAVRDRLAGHDEPPEDDGYYDDEEFDDEEDFEDEDFDDEPRDEADEPPDDEDLDDEDDDDFDDEPEDDGGPRGEGDEVEEEPDDEEDLEDEEEPEAVEDGEEPEADEEDEDLDPDADLEPSDDEDEDEEIAARSLPLGLPAESSDRRTRGAVPDLFEALRIPHRRAPVMRRGSLRVDPATRPPRPDEKPREQRRGRANKPKSKAARA